MPTWPEQNEWSWNVGLTPEQHDEQWKPPPSNEPAKGERGHARGRITLHVVGGSPELRGVPLIGTGPGGLANTRPGGELGAVRKLEAETVELLGSATALGGARFVVQVRVSSRGVMRVDRGRDA